MLILPQFLIAMPGKSPQKDWGVRVVGGKINVVAGNHELRSRFPDDEILEAPHSVLSPGFINTHIHMYGVLAHGIPLTKAPSGFWAFLDNFWWPLVENALDSEMIAAAADWVCAEMLRSGTTSFYDCLEAPFAIPDALLAQKAIVEKRGLRGILSFEATERVSKENGQLGLRENANFINLCQKEAGLVQGMMCFHTSFTCSSAFIQQAFAMGADLGVLTHMHCNEGIHEPEYALEHFGKRTLELYDELGVTGPGMMASQCVQLSEREQAIIAEKGIKVTHMPLSNCEVGGGIAPIPELLSQGVTIGLGSDGYLNDMFEVMRGAFLIHKANQLNPQVLPAETVWYLATEGGAKTMGLDKLGQLQPGWAADLQLINIDFPTPATEGNLYEQLVLRCNQNHVNDVMIAGKWRLRNNILLDADVDAMRARVQSNAERMWKKAA